MKGFSHMGGSNNWVISGEYTLSGLPINSNDPHLHNTLPSPWYIAELEYGDVNVRGGFVPGMPFLVTGRNRYVSQTVTAMHSDTMDFFRESIEVKDGKEYYKHGNELKEVQSKEEILRYLKGGKFEEEKIIVRTTHHGPILDDPFGIFGLVLS